MDPEHTSGAVAAVTHPADRLTLAPAAVPMAVGAVGQVLAGGRGHDGLDDRGRGAGGVVAGEYLRGAGARWGR
ncbi:hypothetical protein ACJ6WF_44860 [Streptomyces sp. MMS24-I2-30]|uniref:hypothetical protein n=1 Tax=Streptomyces sp. MMS24-I2-30 TaxID=3351564 RepID=UPI003896E71F